MIKFPGTLNTGTPPVTESSGVYFFFGFILLKAVFCVPMGKNIITRAVFLHWVTCKHACGQWWATKPVLQSPRKQWKAGDGLDVGGREAWYVPVGIYTARWYIYGVLNPPADGSLQGEHGRTWNCQNYLQIQEWKTCPSVSTSKLMQKGAHLIPTMDCKDMHDLLFSLFSD